MISRIKKHSEKVVSLLALPFAVCKIPPLLVSFLGLVFSFVFAFFILQHNFLLAFFFGLLALLTDLIDGSIARKQGLAKPFGNYLDAVIDKTVDFVLIGIFVLFFPIATVIALGLSFLASYAKPRAGLVIVTDNRDWPGLGERGDKLLILLLGVLAASFLPSLIAFRVLFLTLLLVSLIAFIGLVQRIVYARKLIKEAERKGTILPYLKKKRS